MEKLPHQEYRDTLAEHLKDQDKNERKEILGGAQNTEKYKNAELKKFLMQSTVDFFDKYKELENKRNNLQHKKWILEDGIGDSEIDKYKEEISIIDDEIEWMKRQASLEYYSKAANHSYSDISTKDEDKERHVSDLIGRQIVRIKKVFKEVDFEVFKKIEDNLIEDESRIKKEIAEIENTPLVEGEDQEKLKWKLRRLKGDLRDTQYYLKHHIVPSEKKLKRYFLGINEQEGNQTAVSPQGSAE